jgi:hypothetical protein
MNERIRELAKQANLKLDDLPDEVFIPLEEFAELIVRECAGIAGTFSVDHKRIHPDLVPFFMPQSNQVVYHSTCQAVAFEIKEHFGVEE